MKEQKRKMRFTEEELSLINSTFGGNESLVMSVRKFFLQAETPEEFKTLNEQITGDTLLVLKKVLLPEIDADAPLGQVVDMWRNIELKSKSVEETNLAMESVQIVIDYLSQRFTALINGGEGGQDIRLKGLIYDKEKDPRQAHVELLARNTIIDQVELNMLQLAILAGEEKETPDEMRKRLLKDSSR